MADYRLYCLDGVGKITAAEWIDATGDAEAIMIASSLKKQVECELWCGNRLIVRIPAFRAA